MAAERSGDPDETGAPIVRDHEQSAIRDGD
jgi:hypothetical protein